LGIALAWLCSPALAGVLDPPPYQALAERVVGEGQGVYAVAADGTVLASVAASRAVHPASVTKIASTLALLRALGPGYRFPTRLRAARPTGGVVPGDLLVEASGDPFLLPQSAATMLGALADLGIERIAGGLRVVGLLFYDWKPDPGGRRLQAALAGDIPPEAWRDVAAQRTARGVPSPRTAAGVAASRTAPGALSPRTALGAPSPRTAAGVAASRTAPGALAPRTALGAPSPRTAAGVAASRTAPGALASRTAAGVAGQRTAPPSRPAGLAFGRPSGAASAAGDPTGPGLVHLSPPLVRILKELNSYSNNIFAPLSARVGGAQGVERVARASVPAALAGEIVITNAAGAGRTNRLSPRAAVALCTALGRELARHGLALSDVLPVSGRDRGTLADRLDGPAARGAVAGKTGTYGSLGASALAGVARTGRYGEVSFAILNHDVPVLEARARQDRFVTALLRDAGAVPFAYEPRASPVLVEERIRMMGEDG